MSMDTTSEHGGPSRMSLDHQPLPPPLLTGSGQSDLVSTPEAKKAAADTIGNHLERETKDSGAHADESTANAIKAFGPHDGHGWVTSGALKKAHHTWGEQVQALVNRLSYEKSSLTGAKTHLYDTDFGIKHGIARPGSPMDLY
ncbi:hypothetical protein [Streptomyces violascens]|uniref:Uncharacterized protein n=1 Tax=Streptomyces violascens TaxID=67381 RepID=A0ABQ3QKS9_9ACTN|nr:hypothetical protein [Streptomyces violascens]GGT92684.1 hypothetical protein GCM10010289_10780 [Streptomyces violascens]GHI37873.1 hypothetical protein Sviol_22810 [Streptomyces violascens]